MARCARQLRRIPVALLHHSVPPAPQIEMSSLFQHCAWILILVCRIL
jgi:hypothetical protein